MSQSPPPIIRTYRDLVVWQKATDLAEKVYRATSGFPAAERYGLTVQMRDAATSVPSNIAEGFGRGGTPEFLRFLAISRGSLFELQTRAELARRLGLLKGPGLPDLRERAQEVDRILSGLMRSLKKRRK